MKCKHCGSENTRIKDKKNNRYFCKDCKRTFRPANGVPVESSKKVGMTLGEFTKKYDKEYILTTTLEKVMKSLRRDMIYERKDVIEMTGLGNSFPGMVSALEEYADHYGKNSQKVFFSHPDTIVFLKQKGKLT